MLFELALTLAALIVCSFTPGFLIVRRLSWTPLEKLCGSVGLSLLLIYLAMWVNFCFGPRDERPGCALILAVVVILSGIAWRDAFRLLSSFRIKQSWRWFGILLCWTLVMLAIVRVYSGAGWGGDWKEHFHRTLFFLNRLPLSAVIFPDLALPARPPLMNVVAAFFLGLTGDRFENFQLVFAFLNLLLFLPSVLILPALGGSRKRNLIPLALLFALNPVVMEALTYSWTKAFGAFYAMLAVCFYLAGLRKNDPIRILAAFLALATGLLAHYSVGPYLLFLAVHYSVRVARRREWLQAAGIMLACVLLLATWFGWSSGVYGWKGTLTSNSSITGVKEHQGSNAAKTAANLVDTIVPIWLREGFPYYKPAAGYPVIRDNAFVFYQLNLIFGMGAVGGLLVLGLWFRGVFLRGSGWERWFWRLIVPVCVIVGVAVVGERDPKGVPHLTLLAIEILGLTLLAANFFTLPRLARFLLVAGCAADLYFGVWLQLRVEGLENTPQQVLFNDISPIQSGDRETVSADTALNWALKHECEISTRELVQFPKLYGNRPSFQQLWPAIEANWEKPLNDDRKNWNGWAIRHGGVLAHIGDFVAGESGAGTLGAEVAFAIFAIALLGLLLRTALATRESVKVSAAPAGNPVVAAAHKSKPRTHLRSQRRTTAKR